MKIISIDPGKTGAMALMEYRHIIELIDTPTLGGKYDYKKIYDTLQDWKLQGAKVAVIEQQQTVMNKDKSEDCEKGKPKESPKVAMQIGMGIGMWEAYLTLLDISIEYITSNKWTRDAKTPKYKPATGTKLTASQIKTIVKRMRCEYASQLFPSHAQLFFGPNGGGIDGRADCVLIGEAWFRNNFISPINQDAA